MPPTSPMPAPPRPTRTTGLTLRAMIVDDEALARARLVSLLAGLNTPIVQVVAQAEHAQQALAWFSQPPPGQAADVVLLDIGLPGPSGLRLAERLRRLEHPPAVVFVTAHAEHALAAFGLEAVDYLTKPVPARRLAEAMARVAQRLDARRLASERPQPAPPPEATAPQPALALVVQERGRVLHLPHAEILYLRAMHKQVRIRTLLGHFVVDEALSDLEARLGAGFLRVHRSTVVALHAVRKLEIRGERELADWREPTSDARPDTGFDALAGVEPEVPEGQTWAVWVATSNEWLPVARRQVGAVRLVLLGVARGGA